MKLRERFIAAAQAFKAAGTANAVSVNNTTPQWTQARFERIVKQGFRLNENVYSAIMTVVRTFNEAPCRVWTEGGAEQGRLQAAHPLDALMRMPNPYYSETALWATTVLHLLLAGNAFWELARGRNSGQVREIWPLRPDLVKVIPDPARHVAGYIYSVGGKDFPLETSDVVHFRFPDPLDPYFGMPPLVAAFRAVDTDNAASATVAGTMQKGGVPGFAVLMEANSIADDEHLRMLKRQFQDRFKPGGDSVGFFDYVKDIKPVGMNLGQMAFKDLRNVTASRIFQVLGVPPISANAMVGLENSTYANAREFRSILWMDAVHPLQRMCGETLSANLAPELGGNVLAFDHSEVPALSALREARREKARLEWDAGLITRREFRRLSNMREHPNDDVYKVRLGEQLVPAKEKLAPPPPPPSPEPEPTPEPEPKSTGLLVREQKRVAVVRAGWHPVASKRRIGNHDHEHGACAGHAHGEAKTGAEGLGLLSAALGRVEHARGFYRDVSAWASAELKWQVQHVKAAIEARKATHKPARKALGPADRDAVILAMAPFGDHAFDSALPLMAKMHTEASILAGAELGLALEFFIDNDEALAFVRSYTYKFAEEIAGTSAKEIRGIMERALSESLTPAQVTGVLSEHLEGWEAYRVDRIARSEVIRASNAGAQEAYRQAGVDTLEWVASDGACPFCAALQGVKVSMGDAFFRVGDQYQAPMKDGAEGKPAPAMTIQYEDVEYPPLHPNCECTIQPSFD